LPDGWRVRQFADHRLPRSHQSRHESHHADADTGQAIGESDTTLEQRQTNRRDPSQHP
jgi:hypothetical protein